MISFLSESSQGGGNWPAQGLMPMSSVRIRAGFFAKPPRMKPLSHDGGKKELKFTRIPQVVNLNPHHLGFKINSLFAVHEV